MCLEICCHNLNVNNADRNLRLGTRVAAVSIAASCVLSALNIGIGYAAGSTSVVAAGFEFLGDVLASVLVLAGMILAAKPRTRSIPTDMAESRSWRG